MHCKSRKFHFCNEFIVQQNIFERLFGLVSQAIFLSTIEHNKLILQWIQQLMESIWQQNQQRVASELEVLHLKSSDFGLLKIEKY